MRHSVRIDFAITPPDFECGFLVELDILIFRVFGLQSDARSSLAIALDGELPTKQRQDDRTVDGVSRSIDDRDVARKQPGARHACGRILDQQIVEIERTIRWSSAG
jgi:hypothetical protein